jgi:hypothetical protein
MVISDEGMKALLIFVPLALVSCGSPGDANAPSSTATDKPLSNTRLELTLDDGTKAPPLDGRAFAVPMEGGLAIYVFDAKAPEPTCTDVNVGGWMEKAQGNGVAQIRIASFSGHSGKYPVAGITHVIGGRGKGRSSIRSARAKDESLDLTRYDQVFEGKVGGFGPVSGIVCSAK